MAALRVARRMFCAAAESASAPVKQSRWEALKGSKAGVWCRSLLSDYKEACREILVGARDRPVKASLYATLLGGALACSHTTPDYSSFEATFLDRSAQLGLLSPWNRSSTSDGHMQSLAKLRNEGRLRHISLGLLSLIYYADFDPNVTLYEAQCSNLSVRWRDLPQRVLDVGFAGRWWNLDSKMQDYDINEEEFKHLPPHMQVTSPPSVHEVERNERLHKESWLPLTVNDEEMDTNVVDRREKSISGKSQPKPLT
ncbi:mitochondrial import inner membrane translocase subunit Tim29 [Betta splendens]|uniref:Mitochondrial import inner membrane translocase subunit Tim29 n=1 Tax=Betta splendens TaxID=158456 RepID=A0A6P7N6P8_BETSP|nr:mitochondrial import inner membrane translocase subunit Tim29 [Betta splendens]